MRICPDCRYPNPDDRNDCEICRCDISGLPVSEAAPRACGRGKSAYLRAGAAALAALAVFAGYRYFPRPDAGPVTVPADETARPEDFSEGTVRTLKSISELSFPGEEEVAMLLSGLEDASADVRVESLEVLDRWVRNGVENIPDPLGKILKAAADSNPNVRAFAAMRLGLICDYARKAGAGKVPGMTPGFPVSEKVRSVLSVLLREPYELVREQAAFAVGMTGDAYWGDILKAVCAGDQDKMVRLSAAGALARLGEPSGSELLLEFAADADEGARRLAAQYLAYSTAERSTAVLEKMVSSDSDTEVRRSATAALELRRRAGKGVKKGQ